MRKERLKKNIVPLNKYKYSQTITFENISVKDFFIAIYSDNPY